MILPRPAKVLLIDNYDSFTYNLLHYLQQLTPEVDVRRNDAITLAEVRQLAPSHIVISPGPGTPEQAGISLDLVSSFAAQIPIFGVCLGHQVIGQAFGAQVVPAARIMHGRTSAIEHIGTGLFKNLSTEIQVTRYHSLVLASDSLPTCLQLTAWCEDRGATEPTVMAIAHREYPLCGVQFHPESVLSEQGMALLSNFLGETRRKQSLSEVRSA